MNKKQYLLIALVIIVAGSVAYFYLADYLKRPQGEFDKVYTQKDFPQALDYMNEEILKTSLEDLNKQYQKLKEGDHIYIRWINIGLLKKRLHDYPGAEKAWLKAVEYNPDQYLAFGNLADFYLFDLAQYEKAEEYYLKAIEMRPDHYGYRVGLSALYRYNMTEKIDLVEQIMLEGAKVMPAEAESYYMYLADFYFFEGKDMAKSKFYAQKTLEINPDLEDQLPDYSAL